MRAEQVHEKMRQRLNLVWFVILLVLLVVASGWSRIGLCVGDTGTAGMTGSPRADVRADESPMALLEKTRAKIERLTSVRARFTQKKNLAMLAEPVSSRGEFLYMKGGKFSWHYEPPDESLTVSNGEKIWLYIPALAQVEVYDVRVFKQKSRVFEKLCMGFERPLCDLAESFSIGLISNSEADFEIRLVPKEESVARAVSELHVLISKESGLPVRITTLDSGGDETVVTFTHTDVNPEIDDSAFVFSPPRGVTVYERKSSLSY